MAKAEITTISANQLLRLIEQSGFSVRLVDESRMVTTVRAAQRTGPRAHAAPAAAVRLHGLVLPDDLQILINRSLDLDERVKTLLHELIHLKDSNLSEAATEHQATAIFHGLTVSQRGRLEFLVS